jgi:hypothetical protein
LDKLLLGSIVFFVSAIGFLSYANAENGVFTDVDPDCFEQYNTTVNTGNGSYTKHQLLCIWEVKEFVKAGAIQHNLTESEQATLDKIKEDKESGNYEPMINLDYLETPSSIPKTVSSVIPESCTRTNPSPSDIEECNIDTKMGFCERGIQSTSPIQQYEYFAVTEYTPRDDLQIDLNSGTKPIVSKLKEYEECRAELALIIQLNKTHYVGMSKQIEKGEYNPYHADFVTSDFVFPAGVTKADESEIKFQERKAHDTFCAIEYIQESLRKAQGCEPKVYEGTYKNNTGMTEYEKRLINDSPLTEWYKYKEADAAGERYYPNWIKKHSVTIDYISPGAQIEIQVPRD